MKKCIAIAVISLLVGLAIMPVDGPPAIAENKTTLVIEGEIGDIGFMKFELKGEIYALQKDTVIEDQDGKPLTFDDLKGGLRVRIIGERTSRSGPGDIDKCQKIIISRVE